MLNIEERDIALDVGTYRRDRDTGDTLEKDESETENIGYRSSIFVAYSEINRGIGVFSHQGEFFKRSRNGICSHTSGKEVSKSNLRILSTLQNIDRVWTNGAVNDTTTMNGVQSFEASCC